MVKPCDPRTGERTPPILELQYAAEGLEAEVRALIRLCGDRQRGSQALSRQLDRIQQIIDEARDLARLT